MSPLSPSVYSRNTDGFSIIPNDSVESLSNSHRYEQVDGGSAIILNSQSVRSYVIGTPSPNRPRSTRTSRDWKAWLSHEISGIETPSEEDIKISEQYVTPRRHEKQLSHAATPRAVHESLTGSDGSHQIHRTESGEKLSAPERMSPPPQNAIICSVEPPSTMSQDNTDRTGHLLPDARSIPHCISGPSRNSESFVSTPSDPLNTMQLPVETPSTARMNDRFPFIGTGRRSGSYTSRFSGHSRSPHNSTNSSLKTPKTTHSPKVYNNLPVPITDPTSQQVSSSSGNPNDNRYTSKENVIPTTKSTPKPCFSLSGRVSRPKSLQPLSPVAPNCSPDRITPNADSIIRSRLEDQMSNSGDPTVHRTRVRATLRPMSPQKLARRPKSAFDLRCTTASSPGSSWDPVGSMKHLPDSRRTTVYSVKSPGHHPATPGADSIVHDTRSATAITAEEHSGSITPGQRMADSFLRSRKSGTDLERREKTGGSCLVREDMPAFL
jgi:hypothetical protein